MDKVEMRIFGGGAGPHGEILRCHEDGRVWVHGQLIFQDRQASLLMRCIPGLHSLVQAVQ